MADFKDEILSKTDQKFSGFKLYILIELRQQLKIEDAEALKYELTKGKSKSQQFRCFNNILRIVKTKKTEL